MVISEFSFEEMIFMLEHLLYIMAAFGITNNPLTPRNRLGLTILNAGGFSARPFALECLLEPSKELRYFVVVF